MLQTSFGVQTRCLHDEHHLKSTIFSSFLTLHVWKIFRLLLSISIRKSIEKVTMDLWTWATFRVSIPHPHHSNHPCRGCFTPNP